MSRINLSDAKEYLRVDFDDDDVLILGIIDQAYRLCKDVQRTKEDCREKTAVYYAIAYLYENREAPDFNKLTLNLRSILQNHRESEF